MTRKVVYRRASCSHQPGGSIPVNDEIGLEPFCSYEIPDYLCDLEMHDGMKLVFTSGDLFVFDGGVAMWLEEREEKIDLDRLDSESLLAVILSVSGDVCPQA